MPIQTMRSLEDVARELANAHRAADPKTTTVKLFSSPQNDEIRLLEVTSAVPATGEVLPFRFAPDPAQKIDFASIVILLNPAEWNAIQNNSLSLPAGWALSSARDL